MQPSCFRPKVFPKLTTLLAGCLTLATVVVASRGDGAALVSCGFEPAGATWSVLIFSEAPLSDWLIPAAALLFAITRLASSAGHSVWSPMLASVSIFCTHQEKGQ